MYELGEGLGRDTVKSHLTYVQVWEQHADGWPHLHALLVSRELAAAVRRHGFHPMPHPKTGEPRPCWHYVRNVLRKMAIASGFGPVADLQFVDPQRERIAGYLVKIASELTDSLEKDQRPLRAPIRFRRLRATPGFLERLKKSTGEYTGAIAQHPIERAELALELGGISLSLAIRELMLSAIAPEALPCPRRSLARTVLRCSTREASAVT